MNNAIVEVRPDGDGGWKVTEIRTIDGHDNLQRPLARFRLKRNAVLVGRGAAWALHCDLHVTDRKGRYTTEAASFGHDPKEVKG